jgi:hypothetical protein
MYGISCLSVCLSSFLFVYFKWDGFSWNLVWPLCQWRSSKVLINLLQSVITRWRFSRICEVGVTLVELPKCSNYVNHMKNSSMVTMVTILSNRLLSCSSKLLGIAASTRNAKMQRSHRERMCASYGLRPCNTKRFFCPIRVIVAIKISTSNRIYQYHTWPHFTQFTAIHSCTLQPSRVTYNPQFPWILILWAWRILERDLCLY